MISYARHAGEYLRLRHALGHKLAYDTRILPGFAACLDSAAAPAITIEAGPA